jgi:hypothetical protein
MRPSGRRIGTCYDAKKQTKRRAYHEEITVIFGIKFVGAYDGVAGGTGDVRGTC